MKHDVGTRAAVPERVLIIEIAADQPHVIRPAELRGERRPPHERGDGIAARAQRFDQVRTDETGASGHKYVHSRLS